MPSSDPIVPETYDDDTEDEDEVKKEDEEDELEGEGEDFEWIHRPKDRSQSDETKRRLNAIPDGTKGSDSEDSNHYNKVSVRDDETEDEDESWQMSFGAPAKAKLDEGLSRRMVRSHRPYVTVAHLLQSEMEVARDEDTEDSPVMIEKVPTPSCNMNTI